MVTIQEDGAFRLHLPTTKHSGKFKIKFSFEPFDHPRFGTSKVLSGEIPLLHSQKSLPISNFFDLPQTDQEKVILDSAKRLRSLTEELDEDDIKKVSTGYVAFTTLCYPRLDVKTAKFEVGCDAMSTAFYMDDMYEERYSQEFSYLYRTLWGGIMASDEKQFTMEVFDRLFAKFLNEFHPPLYSLLHSVAEYAKVEKAIEDSALLRLAYLFINAVEGAGMCEFKAEEPLTLSEDTLPAVRGHDSGLELMLEFYVELQGIKVHEFIRKTVLFQFLSQKAREFGALLNDILGLPKDMDQEGLGNNVILRRVVREGISVEQSFQDELERILKLRADLEVLIERMRQAFPAEKEVEAYVLSCMDMCDGQVLSYVFTSMFKGLRYRPMTIQLLAVD